MSLRIGDRERAEAYGTIGLTKPGRREAGAMPVSQGTAADRATDGRPALRRRTLDGNLLRKGSGRVACTLSRTSWGAYGARNQKSKTEVRWGRPLPSVLPSRIFDNGYGSASSWSWEFALFVGSGPSAASLAGVHGWLKKPWIGGFNVAPFSSVHREDLLHLVLSARSLNDARRRARAHQ